jgi:hypothetical protein
LYCNRHVHHQQLVSTPVSKNSPTTKDSNSQDYTIKALREHNEQLQSVLLDLDRMCTTLASNSPKKLQNAANPLSDELETQKHELACTELKVRVTECKIQNLQLLYQSQRPRGTTLPWLIALVLLVFGFVMGFRNGFKFQKHPSFAPY